MEGNDRFKIHQLWAGVAKEGFKWFCITTCVFFAYLSISNLAGKSTDANILINFSASATASANITDEVRGIPESMVLIDRSQLIWGRFTKQDFQTYLFLVFVTIVILILFFREKKLRKSTTKSFSERIEWLEKELDPNRSSSNLTEEGETNPEDR